MKDPANKPEYERTDYETVEELVKKFQKGDEESGQKITEAFYPFLKKYFDLITNKKIVMRDKDTRRFLGLFVSDKSQRYSMHTPGKKSGRKTLYNIAEFIAHLYSNMTDEDIMQELRISMLTLASRYERRPGKNFAGYVYNAFRYEIYRRIISHSKDPITFSAKKNVSYNDNEYENEESDFTKDPRLHTSIPSLEITDGTLDNNWVMGHTCSEVFLSLNEFQRLILKFTYQDGMTDTAMQKKLGMHRHTIRQKRREAMQIVRESYYEEEEGTGEVDSM